MDLFGERLRARSQQLQLSDAEVARRVGVSARRYNHYVTGRNEPNLDTLIRICGVLETTPNKLLGFDDLSENDDEAALLKEQLLAASNVLSADDLRIAVAQINALIRHADGDAQ